MFNTAMLELDSILAAIFKMSGKGWTSPVPTCNCKWKFKSYSLCTNQEQIQGVEVIVLNVQISLKCNQIIENLSALRCLNAAVQLDVDILI